jgi:arginine/ornithine N-succinyltransferase beta subunit
MLKSTVEGESACKVHVNITADLQPWLAERVSHFCEVSRRLAQRNEHKTIVQMFSL